MKRFLSIAALLFATLSAGSFVSLKANAQDLSGARGLDPIGLYTFFNTLQSEAMKEGEPEEQKLAPVITALDVASNPTTGKTIFYVGGDAPDFYYRDVEDVEELKKGVAIPKKEGKGTYKVVRTTMSQVDDWIRAIAVNPATAEVATLTQRGQIVIWAPGGSRPVKVFEAKGINGAHAMKFSPNGKILAVCGFNNNLRFYGYLKEGASFTGSDFEEINTAWPLSSRSCTTLDFYSDRDPATGLCTSTLLAVGGRETAEIWDVVNGASLGEFRLTNQNGGVPRRVRAVAFSPDGKRLAVAGDADQIQIWDVASNKLVSSVSLSNRGAQNQGGVSRRIFSMAFIDNNTLATGDSVNDVIIWDVASGRATRQGKGLKQNETKSDRIAHSGTVASLVYVENPNDDTAPRSLLTGGFDTLVIRWKLP